MTWPQKLFNTYVFGSLHVGVAVVSLLFVTSMEFQLTMNIELLFFVFFATVSGYNLIKYGIELESDAGKTVSVKTLRIVTLVSGLISLVFFFWLPVRIWPLLLLSGLLTFLYGFPKRGRGLLRTAGGIKILIVALVWSLVTLVLPWSMDRSPWTWEILIPFVQRFASVIVLTLPFEIRDMDRDPETLGTIPQRLGVVGTKWMGTLVGIIYLVLEFSHFAPNPWARNSAVVFLILTLLAVWYANRNRGVFYTSFWVESIPIIWAIFLVIGD